MTFVEVITFQICKKAHAIKHKKKRKDEIFEKLSGIYFSRFAQNNYIQIILPNSNT